MATVQMFEDLQIWQLARELCNDVFKFITETKSRNDYKSKEQINGSSGSIMDNIVEGFERDCNKEFHNSLSIAKAFCGETAHNSLEYSTENMFLRKSLNSLKKRQFYYQERLVHSCHI